VIVGLEGVKNQNERDLMQYQSHAGMIGMYFAR
jgi:hypothetical protein